MDVKNHKKKIFFFSGIFIILFVLTILIGASFFSMAFNIFPDDKLMVKLSDNSKCALKRYSFEMPQMTVSFSASQFELLKSSSEGRLF